MKKTIALTLLGLASVFALSTTVVKAVESTPTPADTKTNLTTQGAGISISATSGNLQFEEFTINTGTKDQSVKAEKDLSIEVSDLRGTGAGWEVTAKHGGLKIIEEGKTKDTLTGATISLENGTLGSNADVNTNAPTLKTPSPLSIGESPALISNADVDKGMGLWSHTWGKDEVTLTIPAIVARDMYEGEYSTTITWTLAATPKAE